MTEVYEDKELQKLNVDFAQYKTYLTKKFINRKKYKPLELNKVYAFIPGTITKIHIRKGSRVKEGDVLLVLEAMKMRNNIVSPVDGKITKINVKKGDTVAKNQLLIELE